MEFFNKWQSRWLSNKIGFHQPNVLPDLLKHENLFLNKSCRIFVPLCGKSLDLVHLADKGHDVYGCEFVPEAVQDFFKEQNLQYTTFVLPSSQITAFKAISKKITLYQGDFFALQSKEIGKFDAIWDRGSLVAIDPSFRSKYAGVMHDIMASECKYLLNTFKIEGDGYKGPPYSVPIDNVQQLFSSFCEIKILDSYMVPPRFSNSTKFEIFNILLSAKTENF